MSPESGRNSGGDLFDMAKDGTTVPDDTAKPRIIPSVPRPGQYGTTKASEADPNFLGGTTLAEAADNASDIPKVSFLAHSYSETYSTTYSSDVMLAPPAGCAFYCLLSLLLTIRPRAQETTRPQKL
jgi:hypothetical protein